MFCKTQNPKKSETHSLQILLFSILLLFVYKADIRASEIMSLQPGQIFRDCTSCPELIVVNAGTFIMGSNHGRPNQRPAHLVQIKSPFAIGRFEVTFKEWNKCVSSGICKHKPDDHNWGEIRRPVINVTWNQVNNYLKWLSEFTSNTYRLPSEAEWEYVDKAGTNTLFWWGDLNTDLYMKLDPIPQNIGTLTWLWTSPMRLIDHVFEARSMVAPKPANRVAFAAVAAAAMASALVTLVSVPLAVGRILLLEPRCRPRSYPDVVP